MPRDVEDAHAKWRKAEESRATAPVGSAEWRAAIYAVVAARHTLRDAERREEQPKRD
jgi:hypothetical protein